MPRPDDRATALLRRLGSYEELHVLLELTDRPGATWRMTDLEDRRDSVDVRAVVDGLVRAGLLVRSAPDHLSLAPEPGLDEAVRALADRFASDPLPILRELSERALERVRTAAVRTFADAFVVGREEE